VDDKTDNFPQRPFILRVRESSSESSRWLISMLALFRHLGFMCSAEMIFRDPWYHVLDRVLLFKIYFPSIHPSFTYRPHGQLPRPHGNCEGSLCACISSLTLEVLRLMIDDLNPQQWRSRGSTLSQTASTCRSPFPSRSPTLT
jgi:hypothetical protein